MKLTQSQIDLLKSTALPVVVSWFSATIGVGLGTLLFTFVPESQDQWTTWHKVAVGLGVPSMLTCALLFVMGMMGTTQTIAHVIVDIYRQRATNKRLLKEAKAERERIEAFLTEMSEDDPWEDDGLDEEDEE